MLSVQKKFFTSYFSACTFIEDVILSYSWCVLSPHILSVIDVERYAGDIAGFVAQQEIHGFCYIGSADSLFKEGYTFKVEVYDFESEEIKKQIEAAHKAQQDILERKVVDVDSLNRACVL